MVTRFFGWVARYLHVVVYSGNYYINLTKSKVLFNENHNLYTMIKRTEIKIKHIERMQFYIYKYIILRAAVGTLTHCIVFIVHKFKSTRRCQYDFH